MDYRLITGTLRPRHWIKNSFLFAPALFTLRLFDPQVWGTLLFGFLGFSLTASAVYAFNDIFNRREDREHPVKRLRPVASGRLKVGWAAALAVVAFGAGMGLLAAAGSAAAGLGLVYVGLMLIYTLWLRKLLVVDVILVASGFVVRVMTGAAIIAEPVSHWLLLCTFTVALFLAMIKRRQEIAAAAGTVETGEVGAARTVLVKYPPLGVLDNWIAVLAGMTVLCYALYTVDPQTIAKHHTGALIYTTPFVLYGIFRYQQLASVGRAGEDPTGILMRDLGMKVVVLLWVGVVGVILYMARG